MLQPARDIGNQGSLPCGPLNLRRIEEQASGIIMCVVFEVDLPAPLQALS